MKFMTISEEAVVEFKSFLTENNIDKLNIRINLAGFGCSGPAFNITVDEATDADSVETISDVNFIAENGLIKEFGGFIILSSDENEGMGLSLRPVIQQEGGGCASCNGGCH